MARNDPVPHWGGTWTSSNLTRQQPLLAIFLTIAIGYTVGEISGRRIFARGGHGPFRRAGQGWLVLWSSPPSAILGNFGLALFLYAVGIQYGEAVLHRRYECLGLERQPGSAYRSDDRRRSLAPFLKFANLNDRDTHSDYSRARERPLRRLQAAIAALGNDDPAVGYSVAYPFGWPALFCSCFSPSLLLKPKSTCPRRRAGCSNSSFNVPTFRQSL